ncbi:hypothetical protein D3C87_1459040 [compost metagenome]
MGDGRQNAHALLHELGDAVTHGVERHRRVGHLARAGLAHARRGLVRVERVRRIGQRRQRPDGLPHRKPAAQHQQGKLRHHHIGEPARQRRHGRVDVDGQRAAVAQRQVRLQALAVARNHLDPDRKALAGRLLDLGGDVLGAHGHVGHARQPRTEDVAVRRPVQPVDPVRALGGRQAVENGNGGRHFILQRAQHDRARGDVAFHEQHRERHRIGDDQPRQQDQEQPRAQGAGPPAHPRRRYQGGHGHSRASVISTGIAST